MILGIDTATTFPTRQDIKLGSETFTLVNGDDRPETFIAGEDHVLQNGKEIDGKKFLERFGLDPQAPFQIRGVLAYFAKLEETRASVSSGNGFNLDWKVEFCGTLPNTLVSPCIGKSDAQLAAALFASDAERTAAGLQYTQQAAKNLGTYGRANMIFKYQNSQLLRDADQQLKTAAALLGEEHSVIKALQTELTAKFEAGTRVLNIVSLRIDEIVDAHKANAKSSDYQAKRTRFVHDFGEGSQELLHRETSVVTGARGVYIY